MNRQRIRSGEVENQEDLDRPLPHPFQFGQLLNDLGAGQVVAVGQRRKPTSNLSLVIPNSNGRFGGRFLHPVTRKMTSFKGVLMQGLPWIEPTEKLTVGGGWFLGTNQAGSLWIELKPWRLKWR